MAENPTQNHSQKRQGEDAVSLPANASRKLRWGSRMLIATAILFLIQGLGMIYRALIENRYELGVTDLGGHTATELAETNPAVQSYIDHLAVNLGGLMIAAGIAMGALVWYGVRRGDLWALVTAVSIPTLYALIGLPIHQTVHFDYHQLIHLGPAGIGIPLLITGAVLAFRGLQSVNRDTQRRGGSEEH